MRVDASTYTEATAQIIEWSRQSTTTPRQVCGANVHMTMEAYDLAEFQAIINSSDMVTSDGMPLVWMLRRLGLQQAERVYGPTRTLLVCEVAVRLWLRYLFNNPRFLSAAVQPATKRPRWVAIPVTLGF